MALYMKNFLFVSCACAYVCVATCVCRVHVRMCAWPRACAVCMCVCVRDHVRVPCAPACLCICVRGSEVGRAGMYQCVIVVSWLHTVHRTRAHHVYLRGWGGEGTEKELKLSI